MLILEDRSAFVPLPFDCGCLPRKLLLFTAFGFLGSVSDHVSFILIFFPHALLGASYICRSYQFISIAQLSLCFLDSESGWFFYSSIECVKDESKNDVASLSLRIYCCCAYYTIFCYYQIIKIYLLLTEIIYNYYQHENTWQYFEFTSFVILSP